MSWGLAKFLGGLVLGAALVGLVAKLRRVMHVKKTARKEVTMDIKEMNLEALKWVRSLPEDEFLEEWKKHSGGRE